MRLRAGEGYGLQIDSRYEEGTVVTVRLPLVTEYLTDSMDSDSKNPDSMDSDSKNPDPKDPDSKDPEPKDTDSKEN
jgi:hypothetical protein